MSEAEGCARRIRACYGAALEEPAGVLHIAAVWRDPRGGWPTLRITPQTPRSATDRFALGLARARADAVLTTGRILREEPALEHRYHEDAPLDAALTQWRNERLDKRVPPVSAVLTSGRGLDVGHPLFAGPAAVWVLTRPDAADALRARGLAARHRVVERAEWTLHDALASLRREAGFATIAIEAGASTTRALYAAELGVDELMLSCFEGAELPESLRGAGFATSRELAGVFGPPLSLHIEQEHSGRWSFLRFRRAEPERRPAEPTANPDREGRRHGRRS